MPNKRSGRYRSSIFGSIVKSFRLAKFANQNPTSDPPDLIESSGTCHLSRRHFLRKSGYLAFSSYLAACSTLRPASSFVDKNVIIVGAGLAGLNVAYQLQKVGIQSKIFEASNRTGGRIFSQPNLLAKGLVTELGGEFIDSSHSDIFTLAGELGLELVDVKAGAESKYRTTYFFGNTHYSEQQIVEAFRPIASKIENDFNLLGELVNFQNDGGAKHLDNLSISEYLNKLGVNGYIKNLLEVAYTTEYGLEASEQSALNLIYLIGLDLSSNQMKLFGDSDERFKIKNGNQQLTNSLARIIHAPVLLDHSLEAIRSSGSSYVLSFLTNGKAVEIKADVVVLTVPFSILRNIKFDVDMPLYKRNAIERLNYGTNSKLLIGYTDRYWRTRQLSGSFFTDEACQSGWDNSRLQNPIDGGLTLYFGGKAGVNVGQSTAKAQAERFSPGLDRLFPASTERQSGVFERFHWPSYPFSLGSYAAYQRGQWTSLAGAEGVPVGNIFFAGEHCSYNFQGFMNGAAETGRKVAEAIANPVLRLGRT